MMGWFTITSMLHLKCPEEEAKRERATLKAANAKLI